VKTVVRRYAVKSAVKKTYEASPPEGGACPAVKEGQKKCRLTASKEKESLSVKRGLLKKKNCTQDPEEERQKNSRSGGTTEAKTFDQAKKSAPGSHENWQTSGDSTRRKNKPTVETSAEDRSGLGDKILFRKKKHGKHAAAEGQGKKDSERRVREKR